MSEYVKCSDCGTETSKLFAGNSCWFCNSGIMVRCDDDGTIQSLQFRLAEAEAKVDRLREEKRELVDMLKQRDGGSHEVDCDSSRFRGGTCTCMHDDAMGLIRRMDEHNEP